MKYLILAALFSFSALGGNNKGSCPQIDLNKKDTDGMPFCPDIVKSGRSAWGVYSCAVGQANSFHQPTADEMQSMSQLLEAYKNQAVSDMIAAADRLNLQACRFLQQKNQEKDSLLLFYVKPGVRDYSGPFMMLRETKKSKVLVIAPHDDVDSTGLDTKLATAESFAMGTISNGHRRGNVRKRGGTSKIDDFVHSSGAESNLGTFAVKKMCELYPNSVVMHIHGMADHTKALSRSRSPEFLKAYQTAVTNHTYIKTFAPLNAYFSIDPIVNTNWYVKSEIPVRVHNNSLHALGGVVREIETYDWAWEK